MNNRKNKSYKEYMKSLGFNIDSFDPMVRRELREMFDALFDSKKRKAIPSKMSKPANRFLNAAVNEQRNTCLAIAVENMRLRNKIRQIRKDLDTIAKYNSGFVVPADVSKWLTERE